MEHLLAILRELSVSLELSTALVGFWVVDLVESGSDFQAEDVIASRKPKHRRQEKSNIKGHDNKHENICEYQCKEVEHKWLGSFSQGVGLSSLGVATLENGFDILFVLGLAPETQEVEEFDQEGQGEREDHSQSIPSFHFFC